MNLLAIIKNVRSQEYMENISGYFHKYVIILYNCIVHLNIENSENLELLIWCNNTQEDIFYTEWEHVIYNPNPALQRVTTVRGKHSQLWSKDPSSDSCRVPNCFR